MASYLDARAHRGQWLLRIEDIDTPRMVPGADSVIMGQLHALDMHWDGAPVWQSQRLARYQEAFDTLLQGQKVYGCACTRLEISHALKVQAQFNRAGASSITQERPYPGTCRNGLPEGRRARAWRFKTSSSATETFNDRWLGPQQQNVGLEVGDFIVKRADGLWAYQLVVVIDDAAQGITDIVRGADLLSSTARQQALARSLGLSYPAVMHVPLVLDEHEQKLSKQNHAAALVCTDPVKTLNRAWQRLGFEALPDTDTASFWQNATRQWATRFKL
jgi:glutamyl-Q tRNA(Asp) synthetase